jgi:hypothetical protein
MKTLQMRCSSLPLFMRCAQSARGEVAVSEWFPETGLGTALHAIAALYVKGLPVDVAQVAKQYGATTADLEFLFTQVRRIWEQIGAAADLGAPVFAEQKWRKLTINQEVVDGPQTGVLAFLQLTGTSDVVVKRSDELLEVTDWKTGRRDADPREQLLGYCALALTSVPGATKVVARAAWLRDFEVETYSLDREGLRAYETRLLVQAHDQTYRPGDHCSFCPRRFACPARAEMATASVSMLAQNAAGRTLAELTPAEQVDLYHRAKDVAALAERVIEEMRDLVASKGREGLVAGGVRLEVVAENRRALVPQLAWPILRKYLTEDALAAATTVHITKAEDGAAENKPRGEGAAARRALAAELDAAGAVRVSTSRRLTERRSP